MRASWAFAACTMYILFHAAFAEEVGNGVISDHAMWVWSKFIHGVCHSHWMRTVAEELRRIGH